MKYLSIFGLTVCLALAGCGGGGSSSNNAAPSATAPPPPAVGSITVLVGDSVLDDIEAVWIDIDEILLLGDDGQVTISDGLDDEIDLLSLRNLTEVVASSEVPAGDYSKIRLMISSLEIQELGGRRVPVVRLPANGKIDLNPQGSFEISSGEDLVVQIDFDLARSLKIVETGNSQPNDPQYRFRPVVFIDVLQTDNLRLTRLFGELRDDGDEGAVDPDGEVSAYDFCFRPAGDPESVECDVVDVEVDGTTVYLGLDGQVILEPVVLVLPESANVFGHFGYYETVDNRDGDGRFFRAKIIALGPYDSLASARGDVASEVVEDAFDLTVNDTTSRSVDVTTALLLDEIGRPLSIDIASGQKAEAWAQTINLDPTNEQFFPAFLVQVTAEEAEEDSIEGQLTDLEGDVLTLLDDGLESCATVNEDTEIQLLSDYDGDAEIDDISLVALGDLISAGVEVEVFGAQNGDCVDAEVVVAEVD